MFSIAWAPPWTLNRWQHWHLMRQRQRQQMRSSSVRHSQRDGSISARRHIHLTRQPWCGHRQRQSTWSSLCRQGTAAWIEAQCLQEE